MKLKRFIIGLTLGFIATSLVSCGDTNKPSDGENSIPPIVETPDPKPSPDDTTDVQIDTYKRTAMSKLDEIVNPLLAIVEGDIKTSLQTFYTAEKNYISGIKDIEVGKLASEKVITDAKNFAVATLKPVATTQLNEQTNSKINKLSNDDLKTGAQAFFATEIKKLDTAETLEDVVKIYNEIIKNVENYIESETEKLIIVLKNKALKELDSFVTKLLEKIPYETVKTTAQAFYTKEKAKLDAVDKLDGFELVIQELKDDLETFALTEAKKVALSKLDVVVKAGLDKLPNQDFKNDLNSFYTTEKTKLEAILKLSDIVPTLEAVLQETEEHIKELLVRTVKSYINRLTAVERATAYDYLPEAMHPSFAANVVNLSAISYDFTNHTNISSINQAGYGEQWQMVVENINQSIAMAKVFNVAQTALNVCGNAIDIYITNSYAEEMEYNYDGTDCLCHFEFRDGKLLFIFTFKNSVSVPGFGSVKPLIKMEYDITKETKTMYISFGDIYKVKYVISDTLYEMATTYGITIAEKSASRSSYLSITKNNNKTIGHIYEYTTFENSDKIKACADFYVENGYVSVVGNKSSGMTGFEGFINELYSATEGRLLGYEVREELTFAGVTGTYNTLWFNLWNIAGIHSVKVTDKTDANPSAKSTVDVYLNGSSNLLNPTYNKKLMVTTSRKYDVELRSRFYYTYDSNNDKYISNEVMIPMMFIQEGDNFNSFEQDIKKDNNITASVELDAKHLNKILTDYDTLIDIFEQNKDSMSSEAIIAFLKKSE